MSEIRFLKSTGSGIFPHAYNIIEITEKKYFEMVPTSEQTARSSLSGWTQDGQYYLLKEISNPVPDRHPISTASKGVNRWRKQLEKWSGCWGGH